MRELEAQALALAPVIASAIAKAVAPLNLELAELRKCLADLPMPVEPDLEAIAALVKLPEVKDGEPGKDAEPVDLEALAKAAAALIVLPEVKDGKDADPIDIQAVAALVEVPEPEKVDVEAIARAAAALIPAPEVRQPQDGRDALDLEILPAIDEAKQYPRGTYAAHNGGLWKSYERTHGMRGWECIVDGIDRVEVKHDKSDPRVIFMGVTKSSGAQVHKHIHIPIQIYKGVYREEDTYEAHDNVTWAGSQWTSTKDFNTDKPGSSDAWQLTVKAGRPGKDLRDNASTFDASKGLKL